MPSTKRKAGENPLIRRVRPRVQPDDEDIEIEEGSEDEGSDSEALSSSASDSSSSSEGEEDSPPPYDQLLDTLESKDSTKKSTSRSKEPEKSDSRSFGDLLKEPKPKKKKGSALSNLLESSSTKRRKKNIDETWTNDEAKERREGHKDHRKFSRSNKHAPTEVSSKVPVRRFREIIPDSRPKPRDPRFDPMGGPVDQSKLKRDYSFLDEYRLSEIKDLKKEIQYTKDVEKKEKLKMGLRRMEDKMKSQAAKEKREAVLQKHKKEEKELVKQGKTPFYLKKAELKKKALEEDFKGLSKKNADHVIERRKKKLASKEKKNLPWERRTVGE